MKVELIEWPESQHCMSCKHSTFVDSDKLGSSAYLCIENCYPGSSDCEIIRIEIEEEDQKEDVDCGQCMFD